MTKDSNGREVTERVNGVLQQVFISYDSYTDNNNYIEYDEITVRDSRVNFLSDGFINDGFKVDRGPKWVGSPLKRNRWVLQDDGSIIKTEASYTIFGAYFFYSDF